MKIEELEIGKWYTIGGGDSYLKCIYIAKQYAIFIRVSEVHYTVSTGFIHESELEDMTELNYDYLDEDVDNAHLVKESWGYSSQFAYFRTEGE